MAKKIQLLLVVIGIALAYLSWQYVYTPNMEKAEQLNAQNQTLQAEVTRLEQMEANRATYVADTETLKAEAAEVIANFPADYQVEDRIMYLYNMEGESKNEVVVPSIGFGSKQAQPFVGNLTVDGHTLTDDGIVMNTMQTNITFDTTYVGLKNVVKYIYNMPGRKAIRNINISASTDGYLGGTMDIEFYTLDGTGNTYDPISIKGVGIGKSNVFGSFNSLN